MFALLILQHDVLNLNIDLDDLEKPQDAHAGFEEKKASKVNKSNKSTLSKY